MQQTGSRLKALEALVQEAVKRLRKSAEEERNLRAEIDQLQSENARLTREIRQFQTLAVRHDRVKARIERLIHKIEKAESKC